MPLPNTVQTRFERARRAAGLSAKKAIDACPDEKGRGRLTNITAGSDAKDSDWPLLIWLAELLHVDPRWLIMGEVFTGITVQMEAARPAFSRAGMATAPALKALNAMEILPWPALVAGMCRYCACTQEFGCGDCYWVDESHTICSACLEFDEVTP